MKKLFFLIIGFMFLANTGFCETYHINSQSIIDVTGNTYGAYTTISFAGNNNIVEFTNVIDPSVNTKFAQATIKIRPRKSISATNTNSFRSLSPLSSTVPGTWVSPCTTGNYLSTFTKQYWDISLTNTTGTAELLITLWGVEK